MALQRWSQRAPLPSSGALWTGWEGAEYSWSCWQRLKEFELGKPVGHSSMVRGAEEGARRGRAHPSRPALGTTAGRAVLEQGSCASPAPQHREQRTSRSQGFAGFQPLSSQVEADLGSLFLVCCCSYQHLHSVTTINRSWPWPLSLVCGHQGHCRMSAHSWICWSCLALAAFWEQERLLAMVDPCGMEVEGCEGLTHCLCPAMGFKLVCSLLLCQQAIGDKRS